MDRTTLEHWFERFNENGSQLTQLSPGSHQPLGLVETWRVLRPVKGVPCALWVMSRDIYWLGLQQATHVLKVLSAELGRDDLTLFTDNGEFLVEFLGSADLEVIKEFRRYMSRPDSGYADGDQIQVEALVDFVNDLEAERTLDEVRSLLIDINEPAGFSFVQLNQSSGSEKPHEFYGTAFWRSKEPDDLPCWGLLLMPGWAIPGYDKNCYSQEVGSITIEREGLRVSNTDGQVLFLKPLGPRDQHLNEWREWTLRNPEKLADAVAHMRAWFHEAYPA